MSMIGRSSHGVGNIYLKSAQYSKRSIHWCLKNRIKAHNVVLSAPIQENHPPKIWETLPKALLCNSQSI